MGAELEYDPTENPRFLGDEVIEGVVDPDRIAAINDSLAVCHASMDVFRHPNWPTLESTIYARESMANERLIAIPDANEAQYRRGEITVCRWLRGLPETTRNMIEELEEQKRQLTAGPKDDIEDDEDDLEVAEVGG